jgi:PAS domain S-box-containing protein
VRILIAEDDDVSRLALKKLVEKWDYEVITAQDGQEAWELMQENDFRLVITDWMMPKMDGLTLCQKIRSQSQDGYIYLIFVTAINQTADVVKGLEAGADDYLTKPINIEELRVRIRTGERVLRLEKKHKELENSLVKKRNELEILLDTLQEEIISIDQHHKIISANKSFLQSRGATLEDVVGKPCFQVIRNLTSPCHKLKKVCPAQKVLASGTPWSSPDVCIDKRKDGRYFETDTLPIKNEEGEISQIAIVARDVTTEKKKSAEKLKALNDDLRHAVSQLGAKNEELKQAMEELKTTQAQMLQSEKMASIGQLASGVAHEINNPTGFISSNLNTMEGYDRDMRSLIAQYREVISGLKEGIATQEEPGSVSEKLDHITTLEEELDLDFVLSDIPDLIKESLDGVHRIKKIVTDLKDFAHPGKQELEYVDINSNIESTLNIVWNELKYKATVEKEYGDLPQVRCYPNQLNQVFMNLLVNAAHAIEKEGKIKIETRAVDGRVEIAISDTGSGIPEENLSRIFDPFFTTKEVGKGTGLGLNVVYNIIEKHKGTIDVESEVGKGARFIIRIPVESET